MNEINDEEEQKTQCLVTRAASYERSVSIE